MRNKFIILGLFFSSLMIFYIAVLIKFQVIEQVQYKEKVDNLASRREILQSFRGRIFDRNVNSALAYNVSRYQMILYPQNFIRTKAIIEETAKQLDISQNLIIDAISKKNSDYVVLLDNLEYDQVIRYIENTKSIKGIDWKRTIQREYFEENLMTHVLGYVGDISAHELQTYAYKGYYNFDVVGKVGVEKQYEDLLRGKSGVSSQKVNVFGQKVDKAKTIEEEIQPGNDIVLTLDVDIQRIVEDAIGDRTGAAIMMNAYSGEILAMASHPSYNSNLIVNSLNEKVLSDIQKDANFPFLNRAIQSTAPPGSTFKVLMTLAYLGEDPFNSMGHWTHKVYDPGYIRIGDRLFRCWYRKGHGYENYWKALEDSCNVFFYSIGTDIGVSVIYKYARSFGLGELTGIDLPSENVGVLPSPDWKQRQYSQQWLIGDTANLSIGQGFLTVTPLQMAVLMAGILNNGELVTPHVLKEVRDQTTGNTLYQVNRNVRKTIDIESKVYKAVRDAMRSVAVRGSSSPVINTEAVKIAGKTGSTQTASDSFENLHSWYLAFAPFDAPVEEQNVLVVWIDASNEWEWWAPKAANTIFQAVYAKETYSEAVETLKKQGAWWLNDG